LVLSDHQKMQMICWESTAVCWIIWKTRNDACFNKKFPDDPSSSIYRLCNVLITGLFCRKTKTEEGLKMEPFCRGGWRARCTQGCMARLPQFSEYRTEDDLLFCWCSVLTVV
jgi:hypothetical protein